MSMNGHELIVGVTSGIAAYKTPELVSQLVQAGAGVTVVMTRHARKFVGPATFRALTGRPVAVDLFEASQFPLGAHIELAARGELLCVAPATANLLAKAASGVADDLLTTLILSFAGPVLLAPAMNTTMWEKPAVVRNVQRLRDDGFQIIPPEEGWLSCRQQGVGRMASPTVVKELIEECLA